MIFLFVFKKTCHDLGQEKSVKIHVNFIWNFFVCEAVLGR